MTSDWQMPRWKYVLTNMGFDIDFTCNLQHNLVLGQSYDCSSASEAALNIIRKNIMNPQRNCTVECSYSAVQYSTILH